MPPTKPHNVEHSGEWSSSRVEALYYCTVLLPDAATTYNKTKQIGRLLWEPCGVGEIVKGNLQIAHQLTTSHQAVIGGMSRIVLEHGSLSRNSMTKRASRLRNSPECGGHAIASIPVAAFIHRTNSMTKSPRVLHLANVAVWWLVTLSPYAIGHSFHTSPNLL